MILVTGATGNLGKATLDFLLKKTSPSNLAVIARDITKVQDLAAKGIEVRSGDYTDFNSLVTAFKSVDTLLLISSGSLENRFEQHANAIKAAKENKVKHIVYTSMLKAADSSLFLPAIDHYQTEEFLKQSGIPYTIFRNTFYSEVVPMLMGDALKSGNWFYAAGNSKANFAARPDMAEALANVVMSTEAHLNKTYEIASNQSYTLHEIAAMVSEATGKTISYKAIQADAMKDGMKTTGMPEPVIDMIVSMAKAIDANQLTIEDNSLEKLLNRKPLDLKAYLPQVLAASN